MARAGDLPDPDRLSIYTFRSRYHAMRLPLWLGIAAAILVLLHILLMWLFHRVAHLPHDHPERIRWYLVSVFDLGEEESVGTWFSAVTLLFIGRIAWGRAKQLMAEGSVWSGWWFLIAIVFHVLSIEEVVNLHAILKEWFDRQGADEGPAMRQVLLWISIFVAAAMVPFLQRVGVRFALVTVLAGALYLGGALAVDHWFGSDRFESYHDRWPWVGLEEGLEMFGMIVFLHGMLAYLAKSPTGTVQEQTEVVR